MSPLYTGIGGVRRELTTVSCGQGGTKRDLSEMWAGVGGVKRQIFSGKAWTITYQWEDWIFTGFDSDERAMYIVVNGTKYFKMSVGGGTDAGKITIQAPNRSILLVHTHPNHGLIDKTFYWESTTQTANPIPGDECSIVVDCDIGVYQGISADQFSGNGYSGTTIKINRSGEPTWA